MLATFTSMIVRRNPDNDAPKLRAKPSCRFSSARIWSLLTRSGRLKSYGRISTSASCDAVRCVEKNRPAGRAAVSPVEITAVHRRKQGVDFRLIEDFRHQGSALEIERLPAFIGRARCRA